MTFVLRAVFQDSVLVPAVRALCTPLQTSCATDLDTQPGPFVIVANHASHLDTPALLAALPPALRHRTAVAAAADYFYRHRVVGAACSLAIGTFPFPRTGRDGTLRAAELLAHGCNVVLFPQGSRGCGQRLPFRVGVGHLLLKTGARALPVAISGTLEAWPRGRMFPRRRAISVHIGQPWKPAPGMSPRQITEELERRVDALVGSCRLTFEMRTGDMPPV